MARSNPHRPFVPHPEMVTRLPEITGNEINGLGETLARRPDHVFWAPDPNEIAFGEVQKWFYLCQPDCTEMAVEREKRQEDYKSKGKVDQSKIENKRKAKEGNK